MTRSTSFRVAATLVAVGTTFVAARDAGDHGRARVAVCFAPGTSAEYREAIEARLVEWTPKAFATTRWHATATDGAGLGQGDPTTLTWAIVPDGTSVPPGIGEGGTAQSDLVAFLNGIYGDESKWLPLFEKVFARWSQLTGVRYVRETADDGTSLSGLAGQLGVRADVRIGGRAIDGDFGVLAYNSYPDDGDMVIDTTDSYFRSTFLDSRRLRNVVSHEHGHGLGLDHVCPLNATKLMEPNISLAYTGPQHDDVLGAQRQYGDALEENDSPATATDLGEPVNETKQTVADVGVDGAGDTDVYAFTVSEGMNADVVLKPFGKTYLMGPQSFDGDCDAGTEVDTRTRADLRLALLNPDGSVLASADVERAGGTESLLDVPLPHGAGRYFVRVRNAGEQLNQMYTLELVVGRRGEKPVAMADAVATWESLPIEIVELANDTGLADVPLRLRITTPPASGKALFVDDRIVYVPARGFTGDARITYEIRDVHAETSSADVNVTVQPSARAGNARVDSDGDGYPDEFETARGTSTSDASSRPGEDLVGVERPLAVTSLALSMRTDRSASDAIALTGKLPVDDGFDPMGAVVVVDVAGAVREFHLDATGRSVETADATSKAPAFRLRLRRKAGVVVGGDVRFDLRLTKADFAATWADEGLTTSRRAVREPRAATVFVLFDGRTRFATLPLVYSATTSRAGSARRL